MLVEPEPWTQFDRGGFPKFHLANLPRPGSRIKNGELDQMTHVQAALQRGDMGQVCKGGLHMTMCGILDGLAYEEPGQAGTMDPAALHAKSRRTPGTAHPSEKASSLP